MQLNRVYGSLCFILLLILMPGCAISPSDSHLSDVNNWPIGASAGRLGRLTEDQLLELKQTGFDCIEIGVARIRSADDLVTMQQQSQQLHTWAQTTGIQIWSIHIPYGKDIDISQINPTDRQKAIDEISQMISLCQYLHPEKLVIHASFEPVPEDERARRYQACKESFAILVDVAANYDARLAVECLPRTCLGNTSSEINDLLSATPGLEVCCDVNHLLQETPAEFIERVGSSTTTLHISDYDGVDERHWLPGAGIINWNNVLGNLVTIGYSGPFMFECAGTPGEKMETWNKLKLDYLQSIQ